MASWKPMKGNKRENDKEGGNKAKRGRGTDKMPVIGAVERNGRVVAAPAEKGKLTCKVLDAFIGKHVDLAASLLVTDEYKGYNKVASKMLHASVNHAEQYVDGQIHTNTMEGFWALVKRAWYGQHHHYSPKYAALYIWEACYKYNARNNAGAFEDAIGLMVAA